MKQSSKALSRALPRPTMSQAYKMIDAVKSGNLTALKELKGKVSFKLTDHRKNSAILEEIMHIQNKELRIRVITFLVEDTDIEATQMSDASWRTLTKDSSTVELLLQIPHLTVPEKYLYQIIRNRNLTLAKKILAKQPDSRNDLEMDLRSLPEDKRMPYIDLVKKHT